MAHHVLGVDLGAYSVKVLISQPGLRHSTPIDYVERPVPAGDEPYEIRAARVLGQIIRERKLDADSVFVAAPGDKLFIHVLEFPFRSVKRAVLESAVGSELENVLPVDLEDMVFSFEILPPDTASAATSAPDMATPAAQTVGARGVSGLGHDHDDEPTDVHSGPPRPSRAHGVHGRVAPPTEGMRLLSCAMEIAHARELLKTLDTNAAEPRGLVAAPAAYARVIERITRLDNSIGQSARGVSIGQPVAAIDIGHERTHISVIKAGRPVYARTLKRGGRHLTETLSRAWGVSFDEAERSKREYGFVVSSSMPAETREQARVHEAITAEITPLVKEINRTLASCLAKTGAAVSQAVLLGGGSRLRGLPQYMSEKLGIPVSATTATDASDVLGPKLASMGVPVDTACLAAGMAFEGSAGRPRFDLRQGELAYKADLSFLRQKAATLTAVVIVIIGFAVVNGFAAHYKLKKAHTALSQRLAVETTEVFGDPLSAQATLAQTSMTGQGGQKSPLPKMTAYDIVLEINDKIPKSDKVTLDVSELDVKPGKIMMKAGVKAPPEIDAIEDELKKIACFKVSRGNTTVGADNVHEFSFTISSTCMEGT